MFSKSSLAVLLTAGLTARAYDVHFCKDVAGKDCPVQMTAVGSGYPDCEVYDSGSTFNNQGFKQSEDTGSYEVFVKVEQPDPGCKIVLLQPAGVEIEGCGVPDQSFSAADVRPVDIKDSYMVTFCCGTADCGATGNKRDLTGGSSANHSTVWRGDQPIEPMQLGPPPERRHLQGDFQSDLQTRDDGDKGYTECDGNWEPDPDGGDFITNSVDYKVMSNAVEGPSTVTITNTRTQTWTQEMNAGLDIEGALSLGVSFSISESTTQSKAFAFNVQDGETGKVVFTPQLRCSTGKGTCGGDKIEGTVCTGFKVSDDKDADVAGTYHVLQIQ